MGLWARLFFLFVGPISIAILLYWEDGFNPAPLPNHGAWSSLAVPMHNRNILGSSERVGDGLLPGPEDLVHDADAGVIYTGCLDGWIKKVNIAGDTDAVSFPVENWVYVGGRPLGVALGADKKELIVAESYKGLLRITREGSIDLLTDEAEGVKFRITDGVDVADDGVIYFTDASYKYNLREHMLDILEGHPNGRLMSFDPKTNHTQVLVRDIYFANGVALSPNFDFLVYCETVLRRCRKYHIRGENKGQVENFIHNLPGFPDNIKYDGEAHFWVGLPTGRTLFWKIFMRFPMLKKASVVLERFVKLPHMLRDSGVLRVSLEGEVLELYSDPALFSVTGGVKIGSHLYYNSLTNAYIGRLHLTQNAAIAT